MRPRPFILPVVVLSLLSFTHCAQADDASLHLRTLDGHAGSVMSLSFSPDCTILASSSRDKTIRLWDPKSGKPLRTLNEHAADVYCVTFSPKGDLLATASADRTVRLWNANSGALLRTLEGHTDDVR